MRIVLDTSVLIDHLRGLQKAETALIDAAERGDELWGSVLTRTEILAGVRQREEPATQQLLDAIEWQDVNQEIADRAGELARRFLRSHRTIDTVDFVIAATAQQLGAQLYTCNIKHFPMFPDIEAPY